MFLDVRRCHLHAESLVLGELARGKSQDSVHDRATRPAGKVYGILIPLHAFLAAEWRNSLGGHRVVVAEVSQPDRRTAGAGHSISQNFCPTYTDLRMAGADPTVSRSRKSVVSLSFSRQRAAPVQTHPLPDRSQFDHLGTPLILPTPKPAARTT